MEKREQDILKKIESKTNEVKVPERLEPSQIEKMLEEKGDRKKKTRTKIYRFATLAAACALLAAGIGVYQTADTWGGTKSDSTKEPAESSSEESAIVEEGNAQDVVEKSDEEETDDYSKIYAYIEKQNKESSYDTGMTFGTMAREESVTNSQADIAVEKNAGDGMGTSSGYSETNVRQEGVDEADIVKTDGQYLYVLKENGSEISVLETEKKLKKVGKISASDTMRIQEFYLLPEEKRLVAVVSVNQNEVEGNELMDVITVQNVQAITYDISSPQKPKKLGSIVQSGSYTSSRLSGGCLYLFSNYWIQNPVSKEEPQTYIPMAGDSLIREKDILLPPFERGCMYEVITAVNLENPSEISDSRAIFTNGGELYVSNKNIYYYETDYSQSVEKTKIRKIGYKDGKFSEAKAGSIKGYINDSFSIDEYNGYLRIAATAGDTNAVYVLDEEMKIMGSIKNLAKDEQIYSARFLGDTGYFVTFRQVDPLFSVDLSDPKDPKIIGKLKIPGFSDYLHFYGKDKLLGIGMNADADTGVTDGVKLSMFDLSDKTDVREEQKCIMKNVYSADVSYDYKAALIDVERNIIGFSASTEGGEKYYVFSYDENKGFQCRMSEEINGNSMYGARGVYIQETLYVIKGNVIEAYSMNDYKKIDDYIL